MGGLARAIRLLADLVRASMGNASGKRDSLVQFTNVLRTYYRVLIATLILALLIFFIFRSGPIPTCVLGFLIAVTFFWMRECHQKVYGLSEIIVGLFILYETFPKGRGGFSADFSDDFQKFQSSVVLISVAGAVYIMVRGLDNIFNPRRK
jgi:hypothetical protein